MFKRAENKNKVERHAPLRLFGCAFVLGLGPLLCCLIYRVGDAPLNVLATLNALGWLGLGGYLSSQQRIFRSVKESIGALGLEISATDLGGLVHAYTREATRFHRAAYAYQTRSKYRGADLTQNLLRIAQLAYDELPAQAVELSLYDEESGNWTQTLIVGAPSTFEVQSALLAEEQKRARSTQEFAVRREELVVAKPITFARTHLGVLRVELVSGAKLTDSDRQVLNVLATQGGVLLVDARFTDEVLRMRRLGEESARAKTGFLANLSHEIRGPLGVILSSVELALDGLCGELSEDQREMFRMIKESGDHLLDLVNDVLDYARVEAGKVTATPVTLSVGALLQDLTAVIRTQALAKEQNLTLNDVDPALGIVCDKRHARQMLINFLTNAVKYTPEGGAITVDALRLASGKVKISVRDTGIGIPEEQHDKVFNAFERVDDEYANAQTGTGLGMSLTKRLAEVNKGTVGFESAPGEGSTFWLVLPADKADTALISDDADENTSDIYGAGEVILFVGGNDDMSEMIERYLIRHNFTIIRANSDAQALKRLRESKVELALVDKDLDDSKGSDIISVIRSTPNGGTVPLILLSSRAFVFDIAKYLQMGVDRCLSKPIALKQVAATAHALLKDAKHIGSAPPPSP